MAKEKFKHKFTSLDQLKELNKTEILQGSNPKIHEHTGKTQAKISWAGNNWFVETK